MMLHDDKTKRLNNLLINVYSSHKSNFYRNHFKKNGFNPLNPPSIKNLEKIPILTWEDIQSCPFLKRLYKNEGLLTKIVYKNDKPLLVARTIHDIVLENYGFVCERPLVLFNNFHEGVEKSLWFYEHNILPLINEPNLDITALTACKYQIDAILCQTGILKQFLPRLQKYYNPTAIRHIGILDNVFDISFLKTHFKQARLITMLGLPEIGIIAKACPDALSNEKITFHPDENSIVELDGNLIVTRLIDLPTPIIRYQTNLRAQKEQTKCRCEKDVSFSLT
ncbi:hypothetical protein IIA95_03485 [Patescibacteria group bacterium]|nr:hypothetical protein [Patescibacteria group bacterium]